MSGAYVIMADTKKRSAKIPIGEELIVSPVVNNIQLWTNKGVLEENHFRIFKTNECYTIENMSQRDDLYITDENFQLKKGEKMELAGNKFIFVIGNPVNKKKSIPVVFSNPDYIPSKQDIDYQPYLNKESVDLESLKQENLLKNRDALTIETDNLKKRFDASLPGNINLDDLSDYFVGFISKHFTVDLIMLFMRGGKTEGGRIQWRCSSKHATDGEYYSPPSELKEVFFKYQKPHFFDLDDPTIKVDPTRTVAVKNIRKAATVPMAYNNNIFGIIYVDSKYNTIDPEDFLKLSSLTSHVCNHFAVVIEKNKISKISQGANEALYAKSCHDIIKVRDSKSFVFPGLRFIYQGHVNSFLKVCRKEISSNHSKCAFTFVRTANSNIVIKALVASYIDCLVHMFEAGQYDGNFVDDVFYFCAKYVSVPVSISTVIFSYFLNSKITQISEESAEVNLPSEGDETSSNGKYETCLNLKVLEIEEQIKIMEKEEKKPQEAQQIRKEIKELTLASSGDINTYFVDSQRGSDISMIKKNPGDVVPVCEKKDFSEGSMVLVTPNQIKHEIVKSGSPENISNVCDNYLMLIRI